MALQYPLKKGFLYSLKSWELRNGSELFKGLLSFKVIAKITGRERPKGTGMTAYGVTRGELEVELEMEFEGTSYFEWLISHPNMLVEMMDLTGSLREGQQSNKLEFVQVTMEELEIPIDGPAPIKVSKKATVTDIKIDDKSLVDGDALGQSGEAGAA